MACGLPVILTPNTERMILCSRSVNGDVVPVRNSQAIAEAIIKWHERILSTEGFQVRVRSLAGFRQPV